MCKERLDRRLSNGRGQHTPNIQLMSVTLDVSKCSGWLNVDAPCGGGAGRWSLDERILGLHVNQMRGLYYVKHAAHVRDA